MSAEHFELAVVGGGKGGKTLAAQEARAGRRVALLERGLIGGSCINVACIPTKTLVRSAKVADLARRSAEFGVRADSPAVDWPGVRARRDAVVAGMVARNQAAFDASGLTLILGTARFTGPRELEAALNDGGTRRVTADRVVINTGTRPSIPADTPGLVAARPLTSDTLQSIDRLPEHLVILGGGYISLEFAQMFRRFGSSVTVIDRNPRLLPREDADIADAVRDILTDEGITLILGATVAGISGTSGQGVSLELDTPGGRVTVAGSDLLAALGRVPTTEALDLPAAGVEADARGFVRVNERLETTAPGVWALGDVTGGPQFTHASLDDWRIVSANLAGGNRSTAGRLMPYTLFIDPELGRVGLTEEDARRRKLDIRVATLPASAVPRAVTAGEPRGLYKAVVEASTGRILGASILAAEGGEVMAVVQMAMQAGLPYAAVRDTVFAHPTMAEGFGELFARLG